MNLKRRLILGSSLSIAMMCVIALLSYGLLRAMEFSVLSVIEEYTELQEIDEAEVAFADARAALSDDPPRRDAAFAALDRTAAVMRSFVGEQEEHEGADASHHAAEAAAGERIGAGIEALRAVLADGPITPAALSRLDQLRSEVRELAAGANRLVADSLETTHRDVSFATTALVACCVVGALVVLGLAYLQHRWVVLPIASLRDRVRRAIEKRSPAHRADSVDMIGELDSGFGGLVRELDGLYGSLEERINVKSRELVRSERLASVGYLAAGVAHEINNPLNAILGYTELTLRELSPPSGVEPPRAVESLTVIRDETMRCKHIVEKLLSLVRKSDAPREVVDVCAAIRDVVAMVEGLRQFRGRTLDVQAPDETAPHVLAREAELKQVLVNLIVNALEATRPDGGRVTITAEDRDGAVVISVRDNGHGMSPDALGRVFEPFFTEKRGGHESGTGLGLSIVHAIVEDHGGTIRATSEGHGRGSVFTVSLPAGAEETVDVA